MTSALVVPSAAGGAAVVTGSVVADGMAVAGAESAVSGAREVTGAVAGERGAGERGAGERGAGERGVVDGAGRVFKAGLWRSTEALTDSLVRALLFLVAGDGLALVFL
jgi:hypothetical protein